ncbi:RL10P_insert domain-containing protein [Meloidogyne graminicola]|uniref:Ribosome assembly factor mrt4 n=1 Tax=Meloidogyne graminicola TaxID=189291 RepID=A0A8S9ZIM7_9BILA|nr:RL10P_insert domain-containing protein [Meloidogyne graminicola]
MPKSKRDKIVSLTKVKKKTKETKGKLIEEVRECLSKYNNLFVFSTANLRSNILIKVRQRFKQTSRIFYGRNSVMAVALGKTPEQEVENGLYHIAQLLKGQCGLMFTNEMKDSILSFFDEFVEEEFARAGDSAPFEIVIPAGPVHVDDDGIDDEEHKKWVTSSFEPQLRKLGLQTRLNNGKIELLDQFVVCKEGDKLSSDQTKILRHFGRRLVEFRVTLLAHWTKKNGFKRLKEFVPKSAEEMEQD